MTTPFYVQAANTFSDAVLDLAKKAGPRVAMIGIGTGIGAMRGKPFTYALQFICTDLFWKYIQPNTFQKVFFHERSVVASKVMGGVLSYLTNIAISYAFNKYVIPKTKDIPYIEGLSKENNKSFKVSDVFFLTVIVPVLCAALGFYIDNRVKH